jgi:hypothetical protein
MRLTPFHTAETKKGEIEVKKKLVSGIMATIFLVTMITVAFPARVSATTAPTVYIGILGPKGWIQWDGLWEAAQIARDMINKKAGTEFGPGGAYYWPSGSVGMETPAGLATVQLVDIDEHSVPTPDPTSAIAELTSKLAAYPTMRYIIGGFRTECCAPLEQTLMTYDADVIVHPGSYPAGAGPVIWEIAGAATDTLVVTGPTTGGTVWPVTGIVSPYIFRVTPFSSTVLMDTFLYGAIKQVIAPKLAALYYGNASHLIPTYVIAENLHWCDLIGPLVQGNATSVGLNWLGTSRPSATETDFSSYIDKAKTAGAKLIIHVFSAVAGASFIKQFGALAKAGSVHMACVGINVESQMQEFYASVGGACEYESFLASMGTQEGLTNEESMNPNAKPVTSNVFWSLYEARYGHAPIYTSWGSYDAIIALNETSYDTVTTKGWTTEVTPFAGSMNTAAWIKHMETLGTSDGFNSTRVQISETGTGSSGRYYRNSILGLFSVSGTSGAFHDAFSTVYSFSPLSDRVARAVVVQWQPQPDGTGRMEVVWPRDRPYSRKWIIPTWMYSLETDIAGGPLVPTGKAGSSWPFPPPTGNYNYTTPDKQVYLQDLLAITTAWFQTPPFYLLEADMSPQDHFINIYDAACIAKDWLKKATPQGDP